ncbi:amidohydrolase [Gulosibacter sp. ACHW.36C]|uniref:Amidohydrolase family protein n=1 Tax=Gulosibacter sediminis TaxID=1729695 RepID=A0ABY4MVP0_9MICO|nr:amidohydrolase family protein [Gulosibacter sediminis]UQN14493.1 amidohydrolase family protein [Gulosibacter sediminis]
MTTATTLFRARTVRSPERVLGDTVAVADGQIAAVGEWEELRRAHTDAEVLEYPGATITAGLIDGHSHPIWGLAMARGVDLTGLETRPEIIAALTSGAADLPEGEWLFGWGLAPNALEGPVDNTTIHEAVGPDLPVYLMLFDAHSALLSDAALREVGVTEPHRTVDGGGFTARADGRLSGHALEFAAMGEIADLVPQEPLTTRADKLDALLHGMAATGLTSLVVADAQGGDAVTDVLEELERRGELPLRLRIAPWCTPDLSELQVRELVAGLGRHGRRWRYEGVKLFIDGTIDNGTAWLHEPDTEGEGRAGFWHDPQTYAARIQLLHSLGVPTLTHAIGDRGVRFVAETLAALPKTGVQHRIEHLELADDETVAILAEHNIAVCVQPTHCTLFVHPDQGDSWSQRLGEPRNQQGFRTGDFAAAGIVQALASDWPVAPYDPRITFADAQLRHPHDQDSPAVGAQQALTPEQILAGYTTAGRASIGETGSGLRPGEPADLTIWAADPITASPHDVADIRILATTLDGVVVAQYASSKGTTA